MATHSSTLAWQIPWMEEPGRLQSMGSLRVGRLSDFTFTFHFHALGKEMANHSSVLAWRIQGTGEPGRLPSLGSHRVGHNLSDLAAYQQPLLQTSSVLWGVLLHLLRILFNLLPSKHSLSHILSLINLQLSCFLIHISYSLFEVYFY